MRSRSETREGVAPLFVDTNVFLRFLTWDDPEKGRAAEALFEEAVRGTRQLETSQLVIAEIIWTLESFYGLEKAEVAKKVEAILNTPGLACPEDEILLQALDLYATRNIDFIDAYHAFLLRSRGQVRIVAYDRRHFSRVSWLEIIDPETPPDR